MIQITDPQYYYDLSKRYENQLREETKQRVWLDSSYYAGFRRWLKTTYNINNHGSVVLKFEEERDYIMFLLKWTNGQT